MKLFGCKMSGLLLLAAILVSSCTSYKKVPYLQNSDELAKMEQSVVAYEPKIQSGDLLNIIITSPNEPTASLPYNLSVAFPYSRNNSLTSQPTYQTYLVDSEGNIEMPIIGKIHVAGLTRLALEKEVYEKVKSAFTSAPVVTVRFAEYKVSVLGEVAAPGTYNVANGKVNVFQALALARDMTIHGLRENVKIIREGADGKTIVGELDLTDASVISSPFYQLQQNDIVYVTPNKAKAKGSDVGSTTSLWFSATSILVSLTSLLYNILK
jgi:polysaccharide export outer membrane protein